MLIKTLGASPFVALFKVLRVANLVGLSPQARSVFLTFLFDSLQASASVSTFATEIPSLWLSRDSRLVDSNWEILPENCLFVLGDTPLHVANRARDFFSFLRRRNTYIVLIDGFPSPQRYSRIPVVCRGGGRWGFLFFFRASCTFGSRGLSQESLETYSFLAWGLPSAPLIHLF